MQGAEYEARLGTEVRNRINSVKNGLANRKAHPSYGYSKAMLRRELAQLEGLLYAHYLATSGTSVHLEGAAHMHGVEMFGVDTRALGSQIGRAK